MADRTFARPRAFDCECPSCGRVYLIRMTRRESQASKGIRDARVIGWDERASTLRCHCGAVWIVGLALWRPKPGPRRPALPRDQVPNRKQLAQLREIEARELRSQSGGIVAGQVETDAQTRPRRSNLVAECTCQYLPPPLQFSRVEDDGCPIHGRE